MLRFHGHFQPFAWCFAFQLNSTSAQVILLWVSSCYLTSSLLSQEKCVSSRLIVGHVCVRGWEMVREKDRICLALQWEHIAAISQMHHSQVNLGHIKLRSATLVITFASSCCLQSDGKRPRMAFVLLFGVCVCCTRKRERAGHSTNSLSCMCSDTRKCLSCTYHSIVQLHLG